MSRSGFDIAIPYAELLGIRRVAVETGHVTAGLTITPELANSWHVAHGGAIMSLLDVTCGMSAKSLDPHANGATTVELKVNFLASATGEVVAEGRARKAGRSLVFVEGEVRDAAGHMLAKATGTFKLRYPTSHH
ncbi:MAG: PaaI family thioesterase [Betaproteobacteria bacterium]